MKKTLLLFSLLFFGVFHINSFALDIGNPLPNWIDFSREKSDGRPPAKSSQVLPPSDFRVPAEYEPVAAVVIGWAGYTDMLSNIARAAAGAGAQVWAVEAPDAIAGVPAGVYSKINASINTVWMRDYGPFGLSANQNKPGIVDSIYRHYQ